MATALRKEQIDTISTASRRERAIAAGRDIRLACSQQFTEEEIARFECLGLSSWESR
jgi:hypothetical protein